MATLEQFLGEWDNFFEKELPEQVAKFTAYIAYEFVKRVAIRTRKRTGYATGNWRIVAAPAKTSTTPIPRYDLSNALVIAAAKAVVAAAVAAGYKGAYTVFNNARYISFLEDMDGMVALTQAELEVEFANVSFVPPIEG